MITDVLVICAGYLLGSIPFAFLVAKAVTGKDIRVEGDGNVGTRNAMHTAGRLPGLLTFLLDAGKGAAAYWVGRRFGSGDLVLYMTGFAMMVGHGFPVWLNWRGGKGLAAAAGFLMQIWPYSVVVSLALFLLAHMVIPNIDLSIAVASAAFPFLTFWEGNNLQGLLFLVFLLGLSGVKRLIDLPYERALQGRASQPAEGNHAPDTLEGDRTR